MKALSFDELPLDEIIKTLTLKWDLSSTDTNLSNESRGTLLPSEKLYLEASKSRLVIPMNLADVDWSSLENLTIISGAIKEIAINTQASGRMIVASAIAAFAAVTQGLYDVRSPLGSVHPLSLNVLIVAPSGSRKTTVDRHFAKVFTIFTEVINEHIQTRNEEVEALLEKWEIDNKILKKAYKVAKENDSVIEEEEALVQHQKLKPKKLDFLTMVHDDFTISALLQSLYSNMPVALISTSEGAKVLDDSSMKSTPILNKLWDADTVQVSRISRESFRLNDAKMSSNLMIQPDVFSNILNKRGDELRGSGYLSRTIFCFPQSNIGQRPILTTKQYTKKTELLHSRLGSLCIQLLLFLSNPKSKRKQLQLDQEAEQLWINFANDTESKAKPGCLYHLVPDHSSKLAENVLRTAGVIHAVEYGEGDISAKTLNTAIQICIQSSKDFVECFVPLPQDVVDGQKLQKYLHNNFGVYLVGRNFEGVYFDERFIRQLKVRQCGPHKNAEKLNQAILYLIRQGIVTLVEEVKPKGKKVVYIDLIPSAPLPYSSVNGYSLRYSSIS
jgi:hypothetical protein